MEWNIGKFLGPFVVMATIVYVWNGRQNFIARLPSQKRLTSLNGHYTQKKARWHIYNGHMKKAAVKRYWNKVKLF